MKSSHLTLALLLAFFIAPQPTLLASDQQPTETSLSTFDQNYELTIAIEAPDQTVRQVFLLSAPAFRADLGSASISGRMGPTVGQGTHLFYSIRLSRRVPRDTSATGASFESISWQATVLLPHGHETSITSAEGISVRATIRPTL